MWLLMFISLIFSTPSYIIWNTISLMENALWSTLLFIASILVLKKDADSISSQAAFNFVIVLLLLTRPEAYLWVFVFIFILFARYFFNGDLDNVNVFRPTVIALVVMLSLTVFRMIYFGYPLPNTYYAKVSSSISML